MTGLRFLTAGESHGPKLAAILEGMAAGLAVTRQTIDRSCSAPPAGVRVGWAHADRTRSRGGSRQGCSPA